MAYRFTLPGSTVMGEQALEASEPILRGLGRRALLVTGKIVAQTEAVKTAVGLLKSWGIGCEIFSEIVGEPTDQAIELGVAAYRDADCDFLIAIGGGSPLDSAKAIAAMTVLGGELSDYMGKEIEGNFPPTVLIPTTAGTGSEATKFTVITDTEKNVKMLLKGEALLPTLAVVDPAFSLSAPPKVTAATGMDALTHAVEAYTSRKSNPLTDLYAVDAVKRIFAYLPAAFKNGSDRTARAEMSLAAYEAGVCINNASVTLVHGMSRPIGALFHVPHGISNAMLILECLRYAVDGCHARFGALGKAVGAAAEGASDQEAAEAFLGALDELCKVLRIPTLREYGIQEEAFAAQSEKMAKDALASGSPANTIKEVGVQDILDIYRRLW